MAAIGIVLVNYNSTRLTKKCVRSILAHTHAQDTYTILVFDNDSRDKPRKADFPECELITSKKNLGFAQGNNEAVKALLSIYKKKSESPDYLLFINNDTRVSKGMVHSLVERFESTPNAGFVLPKIYFEKGYEYFSKDYDQHQKGKVIWYAGGSIDWANMILTHKGIDEVDHGQFSKMSEEQFATGCCFLTTPAIWKSLRGFDSRYFLYYEDADLSYRLTQKLKKTIVLEPSAVLYHNNAGSSSGSGSHIHQYYQTRNRLRFGLSYAGHRTKLSLLLEARRMFLTGNGAQKLGILDALGGRWGNQTRRIPVEKA